MTTVQERVNRKLGRTYQALGAARTEGLSAVPWVRQQDGNSVQASFDFTKGEDPAEMENVLGQLIASVASIKDHLKAWCAEHKVPFEGEALINTNRDVAIIHDLWNRDKHAEPHSSRSGLWPDLRHIGRGIVVRPADGEASVSVHLVLNPLGVAFSGDSCVGVDAKVIDKDGKGLGSALDIAEKALDAWLATIQRCGISFPTQ